MQRARQRRVPGGDPDPLGRFYEVTRDVTASCGFALYEELMPVRAKPSRTLMAISGHISRSTEHRINNIGSCNMSNLAPFAASTPHHFEIAQNGRGYWVAKDKEGLIGGVFRTEKDAFRFALFQAGGDRTCVCVLPPISKPRRAKIRRSRR
jgi:hypothetical protein